MLTGSCHCGLLRWRYAALPEDATACNCTICRRYGALWIYGFDGKEVTTEGDSAAYIRGKHIAFHFCPNCGCACFMQGLRKEPDGSRRMAVNLRMAVDADAIQSIPLRRFDGLNRFEPLPEDGRCIKDIWA